MEIPPWRFISCKQRGFCPWCPDKRAALWAEFVRDHVVREEAYDGRRERRLSQDEAGRNLGMGERTVGRDNCICLDGLKLQIAPNPHPCHPIKATVRVHRYLDDTLAVLHGPGKLARYDSGGILVNQRGKAIA